MTQPTTSIATATAHLVGPGKIKVHNGRLAFSTGQGTPAKLDPAKLQNVVCYGAVGITDDAFRMLFANTVEVSWLSPRGNRFRGRLTRTNDSATRLRMLQYQVLACPATKLRIARQVVCEKIESQVTAARHYQRHGTGVPQYIARAAMRLEAAQQAGDPDVLRGVEGVSTKEWFALFGRLLKRPWKFPGRVRRPPTDPVNALLSLCYTWLTNKTIARAEAAGLEVNLGALHDFRPGRPSLACDLVEPLRAPVVDRWVLQQCNRSRLHPGDFSASPGQGVRLKRDRFAVVLTKWEEYWLARDNNRLLERHIKAYIASLRRQAARQAELD